MANVQTARNDALLAVSQAYFVLQDARGRLVGVEATIVRARRLVDLAVGLAPGADRSAGNQPGEGRAPEPHADTRNRDTGLASRQRGAGQVLLLDPETLLEPVEPPFVQVDA